MMILNNSPVSQFKYRNHTFFVKRDDLLDKNFNGNKARKLAFYLDNDFPVINTIISYGGNQSNLMYSLSCLAKLKNWQFIYYTRPLSKTVKDSKHNNLELSLKNGMQLIELDKEYNQFTSSLCTTSNQLLICQGALQIEAEYGIKQLAKEINKWAVLNHLESINIFLPSGTGTTAFFLQKYLDKHQVITTNCVGSRDYLIEQMSSINYDNSKLPVVIDNKQYRFATPYEELLTTIREINKVSQIEFDLIYDPVGWKILLENLETIKGSILYLHCGGLTGNYSMQQRYNYLKNKSATS